MLHMIGHIIFGLIVGLIASWLLGFHSGSLIVVCLLGIVGAWLGGFIGRAIGWYPPGHPAGFFMALLGAVVLILIWKWIGGRSARAELQIQPASVIQAALVHSPGVSLLLG